jgi:hypothetical protein
MLKERGGDLPRSLVLAHPSMKRGPLRGGGALGTTPLFLREERRALFRRPSTSAPPSQGQTMGLGHVFQRGRKEKCSIEVGAGRSLRVRKRDR